MLWPLPDGSRIGARPCMANSRSSGFLAGQRLKPLSRQADKPEALCQALQQFLSVYRKSNHRP